MRIAVDAMGGDRGPGVALPAAVMAAARGLEVVLVGREREILAAGDLPPQVSVVDAPDVITSEDQPVAGVRRKRNSSLVRGVELVAAGEADAFVSAGNTGALMVAGKLRLDTMPGIDRPAIGTMLPTIDGKGTFMLDMGASTDPRPHHLLEHAVAGDAFMRIRGLEQPRVALLNVGTERGKGTEAYRRAYSLLEKSGLNFVGNIEGRDVMAGAADVVVSDGFTGNVALKFAEGTAHIIFELLRREIATAPVRKLGALLLKPSLRRVKQALDYREYGGAPLLGLNGLIIKCHGSSDSVAIDNGISLAVELVERGLITETRQRIAALPREE